MIRYQFQIDGRGFGSPPRETWHAAAQDAVNAGYASWINAEHTAVHVDSLRGAEIVKFDDDLRSYSYLVEDPPYWPSNSFVRNLFATTNWPPMWPAYLVLIVVLAFIAGILVAGCASPPRDPVLDPITKQLFPDCPQC